MNGWAWGGQNFGPFNYGYAGGSPSPQSGQPTGGPNLIVSPQLQQAMIDSAMPVLGPGDRLTSASPLISAAPLTSAAPFTMPMGNNLAYGVQSLNLNKSAQQTFQKVYDREATPEEAADVAIMRMIDLGDLQSFSRPPQSSELQYWATNHPGLTLAALDGANSTWLRENAPERAAAIQRAYLSALHRPPNGQEMAQ